MRTLIHTLLLLAMLASTGGPAAAQGRARELAERTIANQHRDDAALYDYERVERRVTFEEHSIASDKTYRVVPTGTGRLSLLIKRGGEPVSLDSYRKELGEWEKVLRHALDPNDPREQHSEEVRRRRDRKRAELINAIGKAYRFTWLGEEVVDGRTLVHISLEPNPDFHPTSRETEMLTHARASVWIDKEAAQVVRGRAEITSDISAGGGLISKIYAGGWFEIEQRRVAPGIWLPARTEFSIRGRMFLFSFSEHKLTETSRYRYIGTPRQALEVAREDLKSGKGFSGDP